MQKKTLYNELRSLSFPEKDIEHYMTQIPSWWTHIKRKIINMNEWSYDRDGFMAEAKFIILNSKETSLI